MASIVTLTVNPAVDVSVSVDQVTPDRKLRTDRPKRDPGGGGINVCRAIHRLGGECRAIWTQGGPIGEMLASLLAQEEISQEAIPIEEWTRENITVQERESERLFRFTLPGPSLTDDEVQRFLDHMRQLDPAPDYLVLSGSLPPGTGDDFYARVIHETAVRSRIVVDTSQQPLQRAVDAGVFLIKPNMRELGQLAGHDIESEDEVVTVARGLVEDGKAEMVVTSLGAGGAMLVTADQTEKIAAPTVPLRSKVGAGDSMVAGLVLALSRGESVDRAVRFGIAAGSAAVMSPGTELCRRDDTERLYRALL
ncbi:MAG: 1-phosphofructokinase family hexose kinase [Armatimonadota bacterium]